MSSSSTSSSPQQNRDASPCITYLPIINGLQKIALYETRSVSNPCQWLAILYEIVLPTVIYILFWFSCLQEATNINKKIGLYLVAYTVSNLYIFQMYYLIGSNSTQTKFRTLKIDRTEPDKLVLTDDKVNIF